MRLTKADVAEASDLADWIAEKIKIKGCVPEVSIGSLGFCMIDLALEFGMTPEAFGQMILDMHIQYTQYYEKPNG